MKSRIVRFSRSICRTFIFNKSSLLRYNAAPPAKRKSLEPEIYQQIIRFRSKLAKGLDDEERQALERRIATYSNSLVKRR